MSIAMMPPHVPVHRGRDVDFYSLHGVCDDLLLAWKRLQEDSPDVFRTPSYDGRPLYRAPSRSP
jgi:hypothetical protein